MKTTRNETTANMALSHAAELRVINAQRTMKVGANFAKPIPRLVREKRNSFFAQFKKL